MNLQSYITEIERTNDVDTLKALWWTIGMDDSIFGDNLDTLAGMIMGRYNKIK